MFDSGAYPEARIHRRLCPERSLYRQLQQLNQFPVQPQEVWLVSYDQLIRINTSAELAVCYEAQIAQTVEAAQYLDSQRQRLQGFKLVQACQGSNAVQYVQCVKQVLQYCKPGDVIGLGGWCHVGSHKSRLSTFWQILHSIVPLIAASEVKQVHVFGISWWKGVSGSSQSPLGSLLWLCDHHQLRLTTDGRSPIGNALRNSYWRAGALHPYWRWNLALVRTILGCLKQRPEYRPPLIQLDFLTC
ncbi:hypothetical protein QQ056_11390 [Oscillatoria laete-virens NRMC-F 0139]|nr:hypothetical protein [Oscillatoria laete-virens]MDL5054145.1 hypothetical protein [Oscillatoria laete-virens NRMC-F 0139]